jgi:hypothetical protein
MKSLRIGLGRQNSGSAVPEATDPANPDVIALTDAQCNTEARRDLQTVWRRGHNLLSANTGDKQMRYNSYHEAAEVAKTLAREQDRDVSLCRDGDQFMVDEDKLSRVPPKLDEGFWLETTGHMEPKDRVPL